MGHLSALKTCGCTFRQVFLGFFQIQEPKNGFAFNRHLRATHSGTRIKTHANKRTLKLTDLIQHNRCSQQTSCTDREYVLNRNQNVLYSERSHNSVMVLAEFFILFFCEQFFRTEISFRPLKIDAFSGNICSDH